MNKFPNVLLAEDDVDDYLFFTEALEKISPSYKITRAINGVECIAILKAKPLPNAIFLDLNMPIKSGLDCLKYIKSNDSLKHIPVVILSTSHYIKDIDTAYKNGAHFYIVKPVSVEILSESLEKALHEIEQSTQRPAKERFVMRPVVTVEH